MIDNEFNDNIKKGNTVTIRYKSGKDSYFVLPIGNKLYVNGGSQNALIAAIEALMGCIRTGNHIDQTNFIDFEFAGENVSDN